MRITPDRRAHPSLIEWQGWRILTDPTLRRARPHVLVRARHELAQDRRACAVARRRR